MTASGIVPALRMRQREYSGSWMLVTWQAIVVDGWALDRTISFRDCSHEEFDSCQNLYYPFQIYMHQSFAWTLHLVSFPFPFISSFFTSFAKRNSSFKHTKPSRALEQEPLALIHIIGKYNNAAVTVSNKRSTILLCVSWCLAHRYGRVMLDSQRALCCHNPLRCIMSLIWSEYVYREQRLHRMCYTISDHGESDADVVGEKPY